MSVSRIRLNSGLLGPIKHREVGAIGLADVKRNQRLS